MSNDNKNANEEQFEDPNQVTAYIEDDVLKIPTHEIGD